MEPRTKVVIADANEEFRAVISTLLRKEGFEVVGATGDGLRALSLIAEHHPHIVLTDLLLSGADGFALLEKSAKMPKGLRPEFIMISSFVSNLVVETAENLGAAFFIQKPCEPTFLLSRIKMIAGKSGDSSAMGAFSAFGALEEPVDFEMQREGVSIECNITQIMHEIGFPAHIKGYQYLREAILQVSKNMDIINAVTKELYPEVAKKFHTTSSRVERAIRHAIELAWNRGDMEVLQQYFGCTISNVKGKPTNSEFIAMIADRLNVDRMAS